MGSVIAMRDAVCPAAVGVDIGCGVSAVLTSLTGDDLPDDLGPLRSAVEGTVPVGFHAHANAVDVAGIGLPTSAFASLWQRSKELHADVGTALNTRAHRQLVRT